MSLFENITKKVTDTARAAAKKSGELVEATKLNMSIGAEEDKIEKVYAEIGKVVYEAFSNGEAVSEMFKEQCETIKSYEDNIKEMKQKILDLKSVKICSGCGAELDTEVVFCPKCGAKQEIPEPVVIPQEPTEKVCSSCSASNTLDSAFCTKCGAKFE